MSHAERAHALLSASGAHRWLNCTPSALLEEDFPDTTSEAAAEGTLAHEICEAKLLGKRWTKQKKDPLYQPEMDEHTNTYKDRIKDLKGCFDADPFMAIEQRLDLTEYIPEGFGTADCVLIGRVGEETSMVVVDFKYGKGVKVDPEDNPQLMLYALGAYEAYKDFYEIDNVNLCICQPRIDNVATWICPVSKLKAFGEVVKERAAEAIAGAGEFKPGDWCRFCRAKARCKARAEKNVELAFALDKDKALLTNEELGEYLKTGEDVAAWLSDLKDLALSECLAGRPVKGYKAVAGRSLRAFDDPDAAIADLIAAGVEEAILYERKPLTLAKIEKALGKATFEELAGAHVVKPEGKPTLVEESDKREAITNKVSAAEAFKE
jgi:hypothetical protein